MTSRAKKFLRWVGVGLVLLALMVGWWVHRFHHYTPVEAVKDLRAAAAARNAPRPVERFLELRYGSLSVPANREKAFLDFFNVGHIEGLHLIVQRAPPEHRQYAIQNMAQWVADYRRTLTPEEKQSLAAYLRTDAGRATIQQATAKYLSHDVSYRSITAPVIGELMATLAEVQKP